MPIETFETLWQLAISFGKITVASRTDHKGEFVQVIARAEDGLTLVCSASSVPRALRSICEWGKRDYFRLEVRMPGGVWKVLPWVHYANELAAVTAVREMQAAHPGAAFRFVRDPV